MRYIDYDLDLSADTVTLDKEIKIEKLGWKTGDHFEVTVQDDQIKLEKVDPIVKFAKGYD
jgi:bifunctional DNA-binding transcriptional regulator/antitoxin component of YhaV-PrlF toxin-antitoxin module